MSLIESIRSAQMKARKDHDVERLSVLQVALSDIKNESIKIKKEISDEDIIAVLQRSVKGLKDANKDFESADRDDLVQKNNKEIEILSEFLPEQMSEEEIENEVKKIVANFDEVSSQDFGKIMGQAMAQLKGRADGKIVGSVVKKILS